MKKIVLAITAVLSFTLSFAGDGKVQGTVKEKYNDELMPVPFANVVIAGTTIGATTDFDGNYSISLPKGEYQLVVSYVGYEQDTMPIIIEEDNSVVKNIELKTNAEVLNEFEVVAKQNRETEQYLLMEQLSASTIQQSIGAKELSEKGASDVASGVAKVAGVTKTSSNKIFVRGMGDRYNNALLNGLPIPSPNPDLKVIPLDIFPTSIVSSIGINKTFTPDLYADFAGGTVNIATKSYSEEPLFSIGIGTSVNSQTTFQPFFKTDGDQLDNYGYENGDRTIPNEVQNEKIYSLSGDNAKSPFNTNLTPVKKNAVPSYNLSMVGGNSWNLGKNRIVGFLLSASHQNKYQRGEGTERYVDNLGSDLSNYAYDKYDYSTGTSVLSSLYIQPHKNHQISFNNLYVHNSSNELSFYDSQMEDRDRQGYLFSYRNTLATNTLLTNQITGKHQTEANLFNLSWALSTSTANSTMPDRVQLLTRTTNGQDYIPEGLNMSDNNRFYSDLDEQENAGRMDFSYNFKQSEDGEKVTGSLTYGLQGRAKSRDFEWRQLNMNIDNLSSHLNNQGEYVDPTNPDDYLSDENLQANLYQYKEQVDPSRDHSIWQNVYSSYLMLNYDIVPEKLNITTGVRGEYSEQTIKYKKLGDLFKGPYRNTMYNAMDILPSLNVKYSLTEKTNLRLAMSKTLSRPSMKELSPFQYQEQSGVLNEGNPLLENGTNYNLDLKYEMFPDQGELIAVSVFGKYLDNPIERAQIPSSGVLYSYFNMGEAVVAGTEVEYQKSLGKLAASKNNILNNTSFGINASYLYSRITIGETAAIETNKGTILATNNTRAMNGASPYIINANLAYQLNVKGIDSKWTLAYNVYGKRVFAAGTLGRGDIFEMPVNSLDLIVRNKINDKLNVNFSVKNILNPSTRLSQTVGEEVFILNDYKRGRNVSFSIVYNIL